MLQSIATGENVKIHCHHRGNKNFTFNIEYREYENILVPPW